MLHACAIQPFERKGCRSAAALPKQHVKPSSALVPSALGCVGLLRGLMPCLPYEPLCSMEPMMISGRSSRISLLDCLQLFHTPDLLAYVCLYCYNMLSSKLAT